MSAWTNRQHEILREFGHLGVSEIQQILLRECGAYHTRAAIEQRACVLRVSLKRKGVCPECGAIGTRINKHTGLCAKCSARQNLEEARAFNAILRQELAEIRAETERLNREYDRYRQQNSRLCRKHGLKGKRERQ